MHAQSFAGLKIAHHQFSGKFEPRCTLSAHSLQEETVSTKDSCPERLLEADADLNLRGRTEKSVAVNHVFVARRHFHGNDMARKLGGECQFSRCAREIGRASCRERV